VARSAVAALLADAAPRVDAAVIGVLAAKFTSKLVLLVVLMKRRAAASQAVDATRIDTWNDVLTTGSSLLGIALVTTGWPRADALLALPIAASIGRNGWGLARQSLRFLMGEAPPAEVSDELLARAAAIPGVVSVPRLRAHYVGSTLHVQVNLLIAAGSSAAQSHDIEIDVLRALESDPRVGEAFVHIDTGEGKDGT
jgi:cation diffusion facilitator family transporter